MERYELPEGWEWLKLPEVADLIMGQSPPGSTYNKDGNGLPFYQGKADFGSHFPTPRVYCSKPKKVAQPGDILMSVRAPVGPTNLVNHECAIGRGLSIIRPKEGIPANYLRAYFTLIEQLIAELGTGSTFTSISRSDLENLDVPVSPLLEQQRVVAKIESLFEQSRAARTALTRVPVLMAQFRRAVLASAFRGELVEPDPNDEPAVSLLERVREAREQSGYKKSIEPFDTSDLPELPEGWAWASLEQLSWDADYGTSQKCDYKKNNAPVIRIPNILHGGLNFGDLKFATKPEELDETNSVQPGDLLIVRTNGSRDLIGRGAFIYVALDTPHYFASYLIRYRLLFPETLGNWIACIWGSPLVREQIDGMVASTAGQYNLSVARLNKIKIPLPPVSEQQRIVDRIEAMFAQADIIEQAASVSLRRAEQVDQSILARAFRGELG